MPLPRTHEKPILYSLGSELTKPGRLNTLFSSDIPSYRAGSGRLKDARFPQFCRA